MMAKTIAKKAGIARRRVDISTPSSAAKSPRLPELTALPRPHQGLAFFAWTFRNELLGCENCKPDATRVKRKSYIVKGLLLSAPCIESRLSGLPTSAGTQHWRARVRTLATGYWLLVSIIQGPRSRGQEPGARSQEPGARSQEPGARSQSWKHVRSRSNHQFTQQRSMTS